MIEQPAGTCHPNRNELLLERGVCPVNVELFLEEKKAIEGLSIEQELPRFEYYGSNLAELAVTLELRLREIGTNSDDVLQTISNLFARLAAVEITEFKGTSVWVAVRISLPNHNFDIPRWHVDGSYFSSNDKVYKFVYTIKGPQRDLQ